MEPWPGKTTDSTDHLRLTVARMQHSGIRGRVTIYPDSISSGLRLLFRVTEFDDDKVVLDGNHPLAGMPLVFHCTVAAVRAASAAEIKRKGV